MAKADGGRLTTHVLDTASGLPAAGLKIDLFRVSGDGRSHVKSAVTNDDGRCDAPLLQGDEFAIGEYELVFGAGDYLRAAERRCQTRRSSTRSRSASAWLSKSIITCRCWSRPTAIRPTGEAEHGKAEGPG